VAVNAAVVAHFDPHDRIDAVFRDVLSCVSHVCDRIIVVTTSQVATDALDDLPHVQVVRRPNVGYDFMSYRVGLTHIQDAFDLKSVLLLNSSFVVFDPDAFTNTLRRMIQATERSDVVGLTASEQIHWHLQSYLLAFSPRAARAPWFRGFFEAVRPLNTKLELILSYELGLSRLLRENDVRTESICELGTREWLVACGRWLRALAKDRGWTFWCTPEPYRHWRKVNLMQFAAAPIAARHGIVKTEVLRSNPHESDTGALMSFCSPERIHSIEQSLARVRGQYQAGKDGLSTLAHDGLTIDPRRVVESCPRGADRPRVAVALHLYYVDLMPEICEQLRAILEPFDLYVTTPFEADVPTILNTTSAIANRTTVCIVENRGRDIRPFLMLLRSGLLDGYAVCLKLHGKKSTYSARGADWRRQLYGDLLGTSLIARQSLALFEDPAVGMVGSCRYFLSHPRFWGANEVRLRGLLEATGLEGKPDEPALAFYAGSMFWFRPQALGPLAKLPERVLAFEEEAGQQDGTLAHACERAFALVAGRAGYRSTAVPLAGGDILKHDSIAHDVPVL
jgi:lipopolysaccharide biosynthesis protein